jgi:hypothetical protein
MRWAVLLLHTFPQVATIQAMHLTHQRWKPVKLWAKINILFLSLLSHAFVIVKESHLTQQWSWEAKAMERILCSQSKDDRQVVRW